MWHKKCLQRNWYLQKTLPNVNAEILDENVRKAYEIGPRRCDLQADKPLPTKAQLAFEMRGLAKLMEDICSKDACVQFQSLNTLMDVVLNPLERERAIQHFGVVKRLNNILLRKLKKEQDNVGRIGIILRIFETLAATLEGAMELTSFCTLVQTLYDLILKGTQFALKSADILNLITSHPKVALKLLNSKYLDKIHALLKTVPSAWRLPHFLAHVAAIIPLNPSKFVAEGYFQMFYARIVQRNDVQEVVVRCFALLLSCKEGQEVMDAHDGVTVLYQLLLDEGLAVGVHESVCLALQNGTVSKKAVWRCREFWDLPVLLIRRAYGKTSARMQLYALQTLRQITAMPSVKNFVRKVCKKQIVELVCLADNVEAAKSKLLDWLRKKTYVNNTETAAVCVPEPTLNSNCFGGLNSDSSSDEQD